MEMSDECKRVIESVRSLAMHGSPSMFWHEIHQKTAISQDRVSGILRRWALGDNREADFEDRLNLLSYALDIQSLSMYMCTFDELCRENTSFSIIIHIGDISCSN